MTTNPTWADSGQGDLLALVAAGSPSTPTADEEWSEFRFALIRAAMLDGNEIMPNRFRPMVRGKIAPRRISAFYSRAVAQKLIEPTGGWQISDDAEGRNAGRPMRTYRWIGGDAA